MAKYAGEISGFPKVDYSGDWESSLKMEKEALDKVIRTSESLPEGKVVGALLQFPAGDGSAYYVVVAEKPLTVAHVPYGDAYHAAGVTIKGVDRKYVLDDLRRQRAAKAERDAVSAWWESLAVGSVVHYHHGFGQYIRCEVVLLEKEREIAYGDPLPAGARVLKPIACIGEWRFPDDVKRALSRECLRPHPSNIFEYPKFEDRIGFDPRKAA
jgi:hypothetical protein